MSEASNSGSVADVEQQQLKPDEKPVEVMADPNRKLRICAWATVAIALLVLGTALTVHFVDASNSSAAANGGVADENGPGSGGAIGGGVGGGSPPSNPGPYQEAPDSLVSSLCPKVVGWEPLQSFPLQSFYAYNNGAGMSIKDNSLRLQLLNNGAGGTILRSLTAYTTGYAEAEISLGGQNSKDYQGIVYTFILMSDPTAKNPDEVDIEILGKKDNGEVQTNWFVNGSPKLVNKLSLTGNKMVTPNKIKFGLRWNSTVVEWYFNGKLKRSDPKVGLTKPLYVWASVWDTSKSASLWGGVANWNNGKTDNYYMDIHNIKICSLSAE